MLVSGGFNLSVVGMEGLCLKKRPFKEEVVTGTECVCELSLLLSEWTTKSSDRRGTQRQTCE